MTNEARRRRPIAEEAKPEDPDVLDAEEEVSPVVGPIGGARLLEATSPKVSPLIARPEPPDPARPHVVPVSRDLIGRPAEAVTAESAEAAEDWDDRRWSRL